MKSVDGERPSDMQFPIVRSHSEISGLKARGNGLIFQKTWEIHHGDLYDDHRQIKTHSDIDHDYFG